MAAILSREDFDTLACVWYLRFSERHEPDSGFYNLRESIVNFVTIKNRVKNDHGYSIFECIIIHKYRVSFRERIQLAFYRIACNQWSEMIRLGYLAMSERGA